MGKSNKNKLDLKAMEPLRQNPFAQLGKQFHISPEPEAHDSGSPKPAGDPNRQPILLIRKEKRKKGKMVTCIYHLETDPGDHLKSLKKKLGTGGTMNGEHLEIQGDHRQIISKYFLELGFKVRVGN